MKRDFRALRREQKQKVEQLKKEAERDIPKQNLRLHKIARGEHYLGDDMILTHMLRTPHCDKYYLNYACRDKHLRNLQFPANSKDLVLN